MHYLINLVSLIFVLSFGSVSTEIWVRGSAVVREARGEVAIEVPSGGSIFRSFDQPRYFPGIFNCRAQPGGMALIQLSNRTVLEFKGEGYFSVERLEDVLAADRDKSGGLAERHSRMIFNLRRGQLLIDSRHLSGNSRLVLETPIGRVLGFSALMLVQIEYDYRNQLYDFRISCGEGMVQFSNLRQQSYTINAGQRISGVGNSAGLSVEMGGQPEQARERLLIFDELLENLDPAAIDQSRLQAHIRPLRDPGSLPNAPDSPELPGQPSKQSLKRPRVIEFAPQAEPATPFRGELKLPSAYRAR